MSDIRSKFETDLRKIIGYGTHDRDNDKMPSLSRDELFKLYDAGSAQAQQEIELLKAENVSLRKFVEAVSDEDFLFNEFQGMQSRIRMKTKAMIENIRGK